MEVHRKAKFYYKIFLILFNIHCSYYYFYNRNLSVMKIVKVKFFNIFIYLIYFRIEYLLFFCDLMIELSELMSNTVPRNFVALLTSINVKQ